MKWNLNREVSKLNYKVQTDAIKDSLIPTSLTSKQIHCTYASEADLLNTVLFGKTAKEWRLDNPELLVLSNMESYNAVLIKQNKSQEERMYLLHELALQQMASLESNAQKMCVTNGTNSLRGSLKLPEEIKDMDYKEIKEMRIKEKHGV